MIGVDYLCIACISCGSVTSSVLACVSFLVHFSIDLCAGGSDVYLMKSVSACIYTSALIRPIPSAGRMGWKGREASCWLEDFQSAIICCQPLLVCLLPVYSNGGDERQQGGSFVRLWLRLCSFHKTRSSGIISCVRYLAFDFMVTRLFGSSDMTVSSLGLLHTSFPFQPNAGRCLLFIFIKHSSSIAFM